MIRRDSYIQCTSCGEYIEDDRLVTTNTHKCGTSGLGNMNPTYEIKKYTKHLPENNRDFKNNRFLQNKIRRKK